MNYTIGSALGGMNLAARRPAQSPAAAPGNVVTLRAGATQHTVSFRSIDLQQVGPPPERHSGELIATRRAFEANLAAVSTADKMMGSLFDEDV